MQPLSSNNNENSLSDSNDNGAGNVNNGSKNTTTDNKNDERGNPFWLTLLRWSICSISTTLLKNGSYRQEEEGGFGFIYYMHMYKFESKVPVSNALLHGGPMMTNLGLEGGHGDIWLLYDNASLWYFGRVLTTTK